MSSAPTRRDEGFGFREAGVAEPFGTAPGFVDAAVSTTPTVPLINRSLFVVTMVTFGARFRVRFPLHFPFSAKSPASMPIDTVTTFFALLALALQVFVIGVFLSLSSSPLTPGLREKVLSALGPVALPGAVAIATVSMAGSLYLSEVAHFLPCKLCWYQRIAMYPTALLLGFAVVRRHRAIRPYATALCVLGALVSSYHILIERFPSLESSTCDPSNPCSLKWVEKFGYVTIPVMAFTGFVSIIVLLFIDRRANPHRGA